MNLQAFSVSKKCELSLKRLGLHIQIFSLAGIESPSQRVHVPNFGGLSGSEDRGGGDNSIQFTNFGRVGDKSFKEWRQKIEGWKGG